MSKNIKTTILMLTSWLIVGLGMIVIFLSEGTIKEFGDNSTKTLLLALLFLFGFGSNFIISIVYKKEKGSEDEKLMKHVQNRASMFGFIGIAMYVFLVSISIYLFYENQLFVPIGWVWFIAYSTVVMSNVIMMSASLYILIIDSKLED